MSNYQNTKATIAANVYTNHNNEVTAEMVKAGINAVVDSLIAGGYLFKGVAIPSTNPGTPDANVCYKATTPGTYTNFGGLVVNDGESVVLLYNGSWTKQVTGDATAAEVTALGQKVDENKLMRMIDSQGFRLETGGIGSGGVNGASAARVRTTAPMFTSGVGTITAPDGFLIQRIAYYSAWTDSSTFTFGQLVSVSARSATIGTTYPLFRIVFMREDGTDLMPYDVLRAGDSLLWSINDNSGVNTLARLIDSNTIQLEQGDLLNSGGNNSSSKAIRTAATISPKVGAVAVPPGYIIGDVVYYSSWTNPSTFTSLGRIPVYSRFCIFENISAVCRFTIRKADDSNFTPADFFADLALVGRVIEEKVSAVYQDPMLLRGLFPFLQTEKYFSLLDNEGFNPAPSVFYDVAGSATGAKVETAENTDNPLGVKYTKRFSVVNEEQSGGGYYSAPRYELRLASLKNVSKISFGFWYLVDSAGTSPRAVGYGLSGLDKNLQIPSGDGSVASSTYTSTGNYSFTITCKRSNPYYWNSKKYYRITAFVEFSDMTNVPSTNPYLWISINGGASLVNKSIDTFGWYIVPDAIPDGVSPFALFPYQKSFYEQFKEMAGGASTPLTGGIYGAIGDSITAGNGVQTSLAGDDPFRPIDGIAKAVYAYWIAKTNKMAGWYNYGISGSTLGDVNVGGHDRNGFSKSGGRYTQLADDLTHISIFFGWNDSAYGRQMKKQEYATATWGGGNTILYPEDSGQYSNIGTAGWVTQEQFDTIEAMTGSVGGVTYNTPSEYWQAVYVGTPADNTNKTFWGAWNIVLDYLINKYPLAKILLIVPYGANSVLRQAVRDAAYKYGLDYYDFAKSGNQLFYGYEDEPTPPSGTINGTALTTFRRSALLYDGVHPNEDGYEYMYPSINAKLAAL